MLRALSKPRSSARLRYRPISGSVAVFGPSANEGMRSPYFMRGASGQLDVRRRNALHAGARHVLPRLAERAAGVDPSRRVLDHGRGEAGLSGVERRPGDAEVRGEPNEERLLDAALAQVTGEPRRRLAVRLEECRVGVDVASIALADHELGVRDLQARNQLGVLRTLDAVIRPQHLGAVGQRGGLERLLAGMARGERYVAWSVP